MYGTATCKDKCWNKADTIRGLDPHKYRQDEYGNKLNYSNYGKDTPTGWNIDHRIPQSKGGSNSQRNLQVMQSAKNKSLGNTLKKRGVSKGCKK